MFVVFACIHKINDLTQIMPLDLALYCAFQISCPLTYRDRVTTVTFNQVCDQTVFAQVHSDTVVLCSAEHTDTPQPRKYYVWLQPIPQFTGQLT